jgi:hypothetical protein
MASIFVQIASYNDLEINETICDAIVTSSKNHQINFGVHNCTGPDTKDLVVTELPNIKTIYSVAPENLGVGRSRSLAHSLYAGEDYYFQIDAHSRFDKNWDEFLISEVLRFQALGIKKPAITAYPLKYWYEEGNCILEDPRYVSKVSFLGEPDLSRSQFRDKLWPIQMAVPADKNELFTRSVSGGCIFSVGSFIEPNPIMAFGGEEIVTAASAFTHGFDLVIPSKNFMYHLYFEKKETSKREPYWVAFVNVHTELEKASLAELQNVFLNKAQGAYGLGTERSLAEFEAYTGLRFEQRLIG